MSAIWGVVDLKGRALPESIGNKMEEVYRSKKIDRFDTFFAFDFCLGCGVQYVTKEAEEEKFPYVDEGKYMVADVILDNRDQLKSSFTMQRKLSIKGVDGSILFEAVNQDMDRALDEMLGAYTFAYYDHIEKKLQLASDAVGNRSVYYCCEDGRIYFSTLLNAIKAVVTKKAINKTWFENYFGQENLRVVAEATETPYEGIYRVEPGEIVTFTEEKVEKRAYWNPYKHRKILRLPSDEEYRKLVCDTFKECVESVIREGKETAIFLSGGLDSNAVAAFAAPKLREKGRKLYSFTSVPDKKASRIPQNQYYVEDETEYIEELQKWHENLVPEYIDASEGDLLQENRMLFDVHETPYKTVLNIPWLYRGYKAAAEKNCGIILSGQYGNITISYGNLRHLFITLFQSGRWIRMVKEVEIFRKKFRYSRKKIYKDILTAGREENFKQYSKYMYDKVALRQVGEAEIKFSLETGVVHRDPTRDKRLIELVLSLPLEQFAKEGQERRLVRQYMQELIPEKIVADIYHRGRQAVGARRLMEATWEHISGELHISCENLSDNEFEMTKLFYSGLTHEYLEKNYE